MYKAQLNQLCHKKAWPIPIYDVSRYGPAHNSRFRGSVVVNGVQFKADDLSRSVKEAQNRVSQLALEGFGTALLETSPPSVGAASAMSAFTFKSRLNEYAQKNFSDLPKYNHERKGPANAVQFKAYVTVGERTFRSTKFFSTLKEAEQDAAKAALMFLTADGTVSVEIISGDSSEKVDTNMPSCKTTCNGVDDSTSVTDVAKSGGRAEKNSTKDVHLPSSRKHDSEACLNDYMISEAARRTLTFKDRLDDYAQKNFSDLPKYSHVREGSGYALRFKADVTVGGRKYHSTKIFSTVEEAEQDAAKATLMFLTADETAGAKEDSVSVEPLLNESGQNEDISMPTYKTTSNERDGFTSIADVAKIERRAKKNKAKDIHLLSSLKHDRETCLDNKGKHDSKGDNVQRVWSMEDEITLLNSILEFRLKHGKEVDSSSVEIFCHFLKGKLSFTKKLEHSQVSEKIMALKKKYSETEMDCFTAEHEFEMKKIASQLWRPLDVNSDFKGMKYPMLEEEVRNLNIFDPSKKLEFGEDAEALEENLRKHKILVTELQLKRKNLEKETIELMLKGYSNSRSLPKRRVG